MATREPSSRRASTIGELAGSKPKGRAMWMAARNRAASFQVGRVMGRQEPGPLDPEHCEGR